MTGFQTNQLLSIFRLSHIQLDHRSLKDDAEIFLPEKLQTNKQKVIFKSLQGEEVVGDISSFHGTHSYNGYLVRYRFFLFGFFTRSSSFFGIFLLLLLLLSEKDDS